MAASFFSARAKEIVSLAEETSKQDFVVHCGLILHTLIMVYKQRFLVVSSRDLTSI